MTLVEMIPFVLLVLGVLLFGVSLMIHNAERRRRREIVIRFLASTARLAESLRRMEAAARKANGEMRRLNEALHPREPETGKFV